jgi:hypothetical protein
MATKPNTVRYELVPPYNSFKFTLPEKVDENGVRHAGVIEEIGEAGYETDDPEVIFELDQQAHAVRRVTAAGKGKS